MLNSFNEFDTELLIFLNNLGSEAWDPLWIQITNKFTFFPLFLIIIYFFFKEFGVKRLIIILIFISFIILFTDQFTNIVKNTFKRLRPCGELDLQLSLRNIDIYCGRYGFFSAHASNSIAVSIFIITLIKSKAKKWIKPILISWVVIFSYSRIYLGVHYPMDTIFGLLFGFFSGSLFVYIFNRFRFQIGFSH